MNLIVSYGQHAADNKPTRHECTFDQLAAWLDAMQPREGAKDGPYLVFADFEGGTRDYDHLKASYAVPIDLDRGDWTLERIGAVLKGYQWLAWTTYKHTAAAPRWRVVVPVSREMGRAEHYATWETLNAAFGGMADPAAKDATRLNYLPGACLRPAEFQRGRGDGVPLAVSSVPAGTVIAKAGDLNDGPVAGYSGPDDDDALVAYMLAARGKAEERFAAPGTPTRFQALWYGDAAVLQERFPPIESGQAWDHTKADLALANELAYYTGGDGERVVRLLDQSALAQRDSWRVDKARRAAEIACRGRTQFHFVKPAPPAVDIEKRVAAATSYVLSTGSKNKYEATYSNVSHALATMSAIRLAFDTFRGEVMLAPAGTDEWRPLDDVSTTRLLKALELNNFASIPIDMMRRAIEDVAHCHQFDSAILWLNSLEWDGVPRVERFLSEYGGAEDNDYTRAVALYLWTAFAGRVLEPGCKADMVPVFIGKQGTAKKSSTVAAFAPSQDYFVEIDLHEYDDNLARLMRGKLVAELSELRGVAKRDLESLKSFITRTHENWIPKYREYAINFPRRLVFIGTTNYTEFLEDETGNRRWLPVEIAAFDRARVVADHRQLWAEGATLWRSGATAERPGAIQWVNAERLATSVHERHMVTDSWESLIERWLREAELPNDGTTAKRPPPGTRPFTMSEVLKGALLLPPAQMNRTAEIRAGRVLRSLGFEPKKLRLAGKPQQCWVAR
jgi:hypothetical protein